MFTRTVLGLDIGSYSIKAAELEAGVRSAEFVRFEEARIPLDATLAEREATVQLFLDQHDLSRELVICAVPTTRLTQRHLRFPFSGGKKVAQAIPFELEEEIPFPLEEVILTHELTLARPGQTDVLVVISRREVIEQYIDSYHRMELEPHILEVEGAVLGNTCSYLKLTDAPRLVVDVGHTKTNLCLLVDGKPVVLRSIGIAGHHLTEAIAKDLSLSYEAAEERKHALGVFEAGTTKPVCPAIAAQLGNLARECMRSVQAVVGDPMDAIAPSDIVLVGGSARLEGLPMYLEEECGLPCARLGVSIAEPGAQRLDEAGASTFAQAAALALRGAPATRATQLNLRQGEFAYAPDLGGLSLQLRVAVALFAVCLVLWPLSLYSRMAARNTHAETLRAELLKVCNETFPGADCGEDPWAVMEAQRLETREVADHLGVTGLGLSALEVMRELSERIPASLEISLSELKIESRSLLARGHAKDLESVGRMKKLLSEFEWFEKIPDPSTERDARRGGQTFSLTIKFKDGS